MALSTSKVEEQLYCPVRRQQVAAQPEERVRQQLIAHMVNKLHFPLSTLVVEKALDQLPHLQDTAQIPQRRADLLSLCSNLHPDYPVYPLLLVECKAIPLTEAAIRQVVGYNYYLKSYFIAVANDKEIQMGWFDPEKKDYSFIPYLPSYDQLKRSC